MMMPARLALALQADGWWLRSEITWCKGSPMPESVTDRPTSATEKVYLLTKRPKYFYDAMAIAEPCVSDHPSGNGDKRDPRLSYADDNGARGNDQQWSGVGGTRNARNWWLINSEAFPSAHFATFPTALAERCIKAGTSERGCCAQCGKPWVRQTEVNYTDAGNGNNNMARKGADFADAMAARPYEVRKLKDVTTTGWSPVCQCNAPTQPCTVLDPFAGAGTTGLVADRLQRDAVLIELSPAYCAMLRNRITQDAPLLAEVAD